MLKQIMMLVGMGLTLPGFAQHLPENHAVNGGVTIVPIDMKEKPTVYYQDHLIPVTKSPITDQWLLIVGIPLDNQKEIQNLMIHEPIKAKVPFHVSQKYYQTQYLTITNKRKVDPYKKDRARIDEETEKKQALFATYSDRNPFERGFVAPTKGPISSQFGLKRVYNKKPHAPHTGLDIAASQGTPVRATNEGRVVAADDYFFTGNTVIIDHGQGVFSLYAHLDKIKTQVDREVKQGEPIGTVGKTGRVTGPHLHWSMIVNQTLVNPLLFVSAKDIIKVNQKKKP